MIILPELTIYISHTCDLACDKCFTFNNLNWSKHFQINRSVESLKDKVEFKEVFILGGEPLLNPQLSNWMQWTENMWPTSKKWIVTNGRHLDKLPNDWMGRWNLEISAHSEDDLQTILKWLEKNCIKCLKFYDDRHTDAKWHYQLTSNGKDVGELSESWNFFDVPVVLNNDKPIKWTSLFDKTEQHASCPIKECMHLLDGRFYRCPQQAILPQLNKKFQIEEPFRSIAEQDVGCNADEFLEWIETKNNPQEHCRLCDWTQKIELPSQSKIKKIKVLRI
jgi:organic radical activating enzyme